MLWNCLAVLHLKAEQSYLDFPDIPPFLVLIHRIQHNNLRVGTSRDGYGRLCVRPVEINTIPDVGIGGVTHSCNILHGLCLVRGQGIRSCELYL